MARKNSADFKTDNDGRYITGVPANITAAKHRALGDDVKDSFINKDDLANGAADGEFVKYNVTSDDFETSAPELKHKNEASTVSKFDTLVDNAVIKLSDTGTPGEKTLGIRGKIVDINTTTALDLRTDYESHQNAIIKFIAGGNRTLILPHTADLGEGWPINIHFDDGAGTHTYTVQSLDGDVFPTGTTQFDEATGTSIVVADKQKVYRLVSRTGYWEIQPGGKKLAFPMSVRDTAGGSITYFHALFKNDYFDLSEDSVVSGAFEIKPKNALGALGTSGAVTWQRSNGLNQACTQTGAITLSLSGFEAGDVGVWHLKTSGIAYETTLPSASRVQDGNSNLSESAGTRKIDNLDINSEYVVSFFFDGTNSHFNISKMI